MSPSGWSRRFLWCGAVCVAVLIGLLVLAGPAGPAQFPLDPAAGGRYLVDSSTRHVPFLINADTPWSLPLSFSSDPNPSNPGGQSDAAYLLQTEVEHGINTLVVTLVYPGNVANSYGNAPFLNGTDITTPNHAFFNDFRRILDLAKADGLLVAINPIWENPQTAAGQLVAQATTRQLHDYGAYVAGKYPASSYPNVFWIIGGDEGPAGRGADTAKDTALAQGILSVNPGAMITAHVWHGSDASAFFSPLSSYPWLTLNGVYVYYPSGITGSDAQYGYQTAHDAYAASTVPQFLLESQYEKQGANGEGPEIMRRQAYWSDLSGAAGQVFGSEAWQDSEDSNFDHAGWKADMSSFPGYNQLRYLNTLFAGRAWYQLVPDFTHAYVSGANAGTWGQSDWVGDARSGGLLVAYIPPTVSPESPQAKTITIAAGALTSDYGAEWFDPTSGQYQTIGTGSFTVASAHTFTSPGLNGGGSDDWVLLLQAGAPTNLGLPTIAGVASVGSLLSATAGSWTGSRSLSYQWQRCSAVGGGCVAISGATDSEYTVVATDAGATLRVEVTANGSTAVDSNVTTVVQAGPGSYANAVLSDGPVGYWRLDEPGGPTAFDRSASQLQGTYTDGFTLGAAGALAGSSDTAVSFAGNGYVSVNDSASLDCGDTFTLEAWVKLASSGGSASTIFGKGSSSFWFGFEGGHVELAKHSGGVIAATTATISDTSNHYYAVTKDGASVHIYIDGVDQSLTSVTNVTIQNNTLALEIGANGSSPAGEQLSGTIDEAAIYPTAVSAGRIQAHYNAGRP